MLNIVSYKRKFYGIDKNVNGYVGSKVIIYHILLLFSSVLSIVIFYITAVHHHLNICVLSYIFHISFHHCVLSMQYNQFKNNVCTVSIYNCSRLKLKIIIFKFNVWLFVGAF